MGVSVRQFNRARVRRHLKMVVRVLSARDVDDLEPTHAQRRTTALVALYTYAERGEFPRNTYRERPTPVFVDEFGTRCAVAHLIDDGPMVDSIVAMQNLERIPDLQSNQLARWSRRSGFEQRELELIQPAYPHWPIEVATGPLPLGVLAWLAVAALWVGDWRRRRKLRADLQPAYVARMFAAGSLSVIGALLIGRATTEWQFLRKDVSGTFAFTLPVLDATAEFALIAIAVTGFAAIVVGLISGYRILIRARLRGGHADVARDGLGVLAAATWWWAVAIVSAKFTPILACGSNGSASLSGWWPLPHTDCADVGTLATSYVSLVFVVIALVPMTWLIWRAVRQPRSVSPTS